MQPNRRQFIQTGTAAVAAPTILSHTSLARGKGTAANDKIALGIIGCGDLGRRAHLPFILGKDWLEVVAVCDVDRNHRDEAAKTVFDKTGKRVGVYEDFRHLCDRKDVDAVLIVTPDHWHALHSIAAMEAGKDVYCEKPLTLTIAEGRKMVEVARRTERVLQTGSMQRSGREFNRAVKLVHDGAIGDVQRIDTYIGGVDSGSWVENTTPPEHLNWDFWLGPAEYRKYAPNRVHYQFRWFEDFSGGKMTDWGAHHNDIAQWMLKMDDSGPTSVEGTGHYHEDGPHDVPGHFDVKYVYPNGVEVHCHSDGRNGVKVTGSKGELFVSRGEFEPSDPKLKDVPVEGDDYRKDGQYWDVHYKNWRECMESRDKPICDVEIGHRSATMCHLGNIAIKLGRKLEWDPQTERFTNDDQANLLVSKPMRSPWRI